MNKNQIKSLMAMLLVCTFSVSAGFYKGLDDEGNVTYSDKPFENAEIITPPPLSVVDPPKIAPAKTPEKDAEKAAQTVYKSFKIGTPVDGQTIWNIPDLSVAIVMKPALDTKQGDTIWLMMDGKALVKKSKSMLMRIGRADRGEHKLQAQLRNKKGKIIKRSKPVTVHIKNTVVSR